MDDITIKNLKFLSSPFEAEEIDWRIQQSGVFGSPQKPWAKVLAYIQSRAIMNRLDNVIGPHLWKNEYKESPIGGIQCGISIKINGEWITKWDAAERTSVEIKGKEDMDTNTKGAYSNSMKRAAVHWGMGRYLYELTSNFAVCKWEKDKSWNKAKVKADGKDKFFYWVPPELPYWALPEKGHKVS